MFGRVVDEDHGKKKNGKSGILNGAHRGHRGVQFWNILSLYLFLFSMVIGLIALVVKGILVILFCWILFLLLT